MSTAWRLIDAGALAPARNMAEDEALLLRFEPGAAPTLRLYGWRPAALSLGRFQPLDELAGVPASIPRVRRITGGGALFHREDELTYAIVAPYELFSGKRAGPRAAYLAVHAAIARGLAELGVPLDGGRPGAQRPPNAAGARGPGPALCYDRATDFDLVAGAGKLVGSAQRRRGHAFLQHGAIPVSADPYARGAVSLDRLLGRRAGTAEVARAVSAGFERTLGARFDPSSLRDDEASLADVLERERYGSAAWTEGVRESSGAGHEPS